MSVNPEIFAGRYANQTAIVTGGGSGIGKGIALRLAREGAHVTIFDVNKEGLAQTGEEIAHLGLSCSTKWVDVSQEEAVVKSLSEVAQANKSIDVLVHCVGITGPTGKKITDISCEDYDRVYQVNQRSSFLLLKCTLPYMLAARYGRILLFPSIAGKDGNPGMSPYSSTKAAIIGLIKGVAKEYAETGITINGAAPAVIRYPHE